MSSLIVSGLVAVCGLVVSAALYANHDAAWYLHMADVWLDGGVLYRDVLDTNPPLIVFITAVPVWFANVSGLGQPAVFKGFVFLLALTAAAASLAGIRAIWSAPGGRLIVLSAVVLALVVLPGAEFGQREHLAATLVMPFVWRSAALAATGVPLPGGVWAGVAAGLGFALKPHFIAAWLLLEAMLLFSPRPSWQRVETRMVLAVMLAYAAIVIGLVPQYLSMARDVRAVYGGLDRSWAELARVPELPWWLLTGLVVGVSRHAFRRPETLLLFAVSTGFLAAALLQFKGWGYHFLPARVFLLLCGASIVSSLVEATARRLVSGAVAATAVGAILLWSGHAAVMAQRRAREGLVATFVAALEQRGGIRSMAMLSMRTIIVPAFPAATYLRTRWVMRHHSLWFLPGLYPDVVAGIDRPTAFRASADMSVLERKYFQHVVDDLCASPPELLVIEPPPPVPGRDGSLDVIKYFSQDARFGRLFDVYTRFARVERFELWSPEGGTKATCD